MVANWVPRAAAAAAALLQLPQWHCTYRVDFTKFVGSSRFTAIKKIVRGVFSSSDITVGTSVTKASGKSRGVRVIT